MIECKRGDVVLVEVVLSDGSGVKHRPAVVGSSDEYNQARQQAVVAAITGRTDRMLPGDHLISDWHSAGLLFPSAVTGALITVRQEMISRKLGAMPSMDMRLISSKIRRNMGLGE